jgi:hypothetical protein
MEECKATDKSGFEGLDLSSMSNILKILSNVFNLGSKPAQIIPPPLLLIGAKLRPGMSARNLSARVITKLEESGIPMDDAVFGGEPNAFANSIIVNSKETVNMLQTEAVVQNVTAPGAIQVTSTGTAAGIPVVVQGANILPVSSIGGLI